MIIEKLLPRGARSQKPNRIIVHAMGEYIWYKGHTLHKEGAWLHASELLRDIEYQIYNKKTEKLEWRQGLSAHILVCPNGDRIKCREDNQGAYHALGFNDDSLGIEYLVAGKHNITSFEDMISEPYLTSIQYESGLEQVRDQWHLKGDIMKMDRHSTLSPERKVDPGEGFPWDRFCREVGIV